jgi:hypothetical protein
MARRRLPDTVLKPGAERITRMLDAPHVGQAQARPLSAMGRRAVKSPQPGQSYSYMGMEKLLIGLQ